MRDVILGAPSRPRLGRLPSRPARRGAQRFLSFRRFHGFGFLLDAPRGPKPAPQQGLPSGVRGEVEILEGGGRGSPFSCYFLYNECPGHKTKTRTPEAATAG